LLFISWRYKWFPLKEKFLYIYIYSLIPKAL
jgi:hypothetical protein